MSIYEFMKDYIPAHRETQFNLQIPTLQAFLQGSDDEIESKKCLLMTHYWLAVQHSVLWKGLCQNGNAASADPTITTIIVPRPADRLYDLLVLAKSAPS